MPDFQKQTVQWFPGHMARTRRKIKESLPLVDAVVELVDARIPESSRNPELDEITAGKPRIILLNKSDVADKNATDAWIRFFQSRGAFVLAVDCKTGKGLNGFVPLVRKALAEVIERNESKGMAGRPLRLMVVGIPNTGKSSFINRMSAKAKLQVANRPGVTRQNQWVVCGDGIELLDTPGVLWPKFDDPSVGDKLAFIGSIKSDVMDVETIAVRLLHILKTDYTDRLTERYKVDASVAELEDYEVLEAIGRKRGMLLRGNEVDTERAANTLLNEYRSGKLGKITLERPKG
ncbi:MAG: ribosome biogenesis GTPase YlqF [Clostridia bacterium]|nr:ribosome biogenesis GTPase YlqF [Clostridia bacterium]MBR1704949.1 ribosome biogenesis GTPase YlqF [Clostridia bacterium]